MAADRATLKAQPRTEFGSRDEPPPAPRRARARRRLRRRRRGARRSRPASATIRNVLVHGGALIDVEIEGSGTVPVVIKEQQRHPVRGNLIHLDLQEVKLDVKIQADVTIELIGAEDAPGVKEGGVLEHVTHEVTISALPTAIPESIPADVSGMDISDTLQLERADRPRGRRVRPRRGPDADEITIATLSPPRVEEEPEPDLEEETELVGEDGEPIEAPRATTPRREGDGDAGGDDSGDSGDSEE